MEVRLSMVSLREGVGVFFFFFETHELFSPMLLPAAQGTSPSVDELANLRGWVAVALGLCKILFRHGSRRRFV